MGRVLLDPLNGYVRDMAGLGLDLAPFLQIVDTATKTYGQVEAIKNANNKPAAAAAVVQSAVQSASTPAKSTIPKWVTYSVVGLAGVGLILVIAKVVNRRKGR